MNKHDFFTISIRGMVAYCVLCLENYVLEAYTDHNFAPVLRLAWDVIGPEGYIDQNADRYMEAIPEYLFEFDDYEAAEFEYLTKAEFDGLRMLLNPDDSTLGLVMHRIYDVAMCYAYTAVATPPKEAVDLVFDVVSALRACGTSLPSFDLVREFSFDEFDGWGVHITPGALSQIL